MQFHSGREKLISVYSGHREEIYEFSELILVIVIAN